MSRVHAGFSGKFLVQDKEVLRGERKHSKKRDAILETIRSTISHPGARWVYDRLKSRIPGLSLGTVYRNINIFREEGAVVSLGVVNGEERFDGTVAPHPHLVCEGCGRVLDLPGEVQAGLTCALPFEISGFTIDKRKTVFYGLCDECRDAQR
ncbi:MAG: transcriptional repressor [Treponema sp.]|nr:transcriptional repressor [Treponema sp.]